MPDKLPEIKANSYLVGGISTTAWGVQSVLNWTLLGPFFPEAPAAVHALLIGMFSVALGIGPSLLVVGGIRYAADLRRAIEREDTERARIEAN